MRRCVKTGGVRGLNIKAKTSDGDEVKCTVTECEDVKHVVEVQCTKIYPVIVDCRGYFPTTQQHAEFRRVSSSMEWTDRQRIYDTDMYPMGNIPVASVNRGQTQRIDVEVTVAFPSRGGPAERTVISIEVNT